MRFDKRDVIHRIFKLSAFIRACATREVYGYLTTGLWVVKLGLILDIILPDPTIGISPFNVWP